MGEESKHCFHLRKPVCAHFSGSTPGFPKGTPISNLKQCSSKFTRFQTMNSHEMKTESKKIDWPVSQSYSEKLALPIAASPNQEIFPSRYPSNLRVSPVQFKGRGRAVS